MGTVTIVIAEDQSIDAVEHVQKLLDQTSTYDPNWNGAEFEIERGLFTCIHDHPGVCAIAAGILFSRIISTLECESYV